MVFIRAFRPATAMRRVALAQPQLQRAAFSASVRVSVGKEDRIHDPEHRKKEVDEHHAESLKDVKKGDPKWKDELASNSESIVKADRGEIDASKGSIEKLQKESEQVLKNKK